MTPDGLRAALTTLHLTPMEAEDHLGLYRGTVDRMLTGKRPVPPRAAHLLEAWVQHPPSKFGFQHRTEDYVP